jgi:hypothetical protein
MKTTSLHTTCPSCACDFAVAAPEAEPESRWGALAIAPMVEVECPVCGSEFAVDGDGEVIDEGEGDDDWLFEVNADGELEVEDLSSVTCGHCGHRHEVGESGITACPRCRRVLVIGDGEEVDEEWRPTDSWAEDDDWC